MIVAILNIYLVLLFLLVWLKIVPFNLFWKISPLIVLVLLMFGLFIPMDWGAPQGGRWRSAIPWPSFPMSQAR